MVLKKAGFLRSGQIPRSWMKLDVPMDELATLARSVVRARQSGTQSRPWVQVGNALQRRILRQPFQSSEQVSRAVSFCGRKKVWDLAAQRGLGETPKGVQQELDAIVMRRNQIVHEGDIKRRLKPHKLKFNRVAAATFRKWVQWIENLVDALDSELA